MALAGLATLEFSKPDASKKSPASAKRNHVCNVCSRAFKRSEHCIRHQRRHTQEKPFACHFCRRRYSRKDLLVRHERTLHAEEKAKAASEQQNKDAVLINPTMGGEDTANMVEQLPQDPLSVTGSEQPLADPARSPDSSGTMTIGLKRKQSAQDRPGKRSRQSSIEPATPESNTDRNRTPPRAGLEMDNSYACPLDAKPDSADPSSNNVKPFMPSPLDLPSINADMDLLEFFDPFFGLPAEQVGAMSLPAFRGLTEGFSPLEQFTASSVGSQPGNRESDPVGPTEIQWLESAQPPLSPQQKERHVTSAVTGKGNSKPAPTSLFVSLESLPIPKVRRMANPKPPTLNFTEAMRTKLREDLSNRIPAVQLCGFHLPVAVALQKCLRTFVDAFHVHLPIFHLPTMDIERTPSPLVLAMCAIGALYRLERKVAASLYIKADQALSSTTNRDTQLERTPHILQAWRQPLPEQTGRCRDTLWPEQTRLLLTMFASFSGDPEVMSRAIAQIGEFSLDFRRLAPSVKPRNFGVEGVTWQDWIERECVKRLLYGHIMLTNSLTMTYGMPPAYSIVSDGNIEMPGDQSLWDATNASQWYDLASVKGRSSLLSVRDAVSRIMYGSPLRGVPEECWSWSPFACTVVINAVSIQIWHVTQGSFFFDDVTGTGQSHESEQSQVLAQTEAALSRCRALITQARSDADYTWNEAEGPLLFNCLALLRVTYCRAFTGIGCADRMMLLKDSREEIVASIEDFVAMPQERDDFTSRAVARAFEGMVIPSKAGIQLLRKTAALTWSVEHALAGWDAALLVTKWVHTIEVETVRGRGRVLSEREEQLIQNMGDLLAEDESIDQATSMAARLAEHWASFYDDTWVWGVTPRMGWILRELSNCYENALLSI